jgi:nitrate reductase gamma subunit
MSNLLHFSEHTLQEIALVVMVTLYFFKIRWYMGFTLAKERQPATGMGDTSPKIGGRYSLGMILHPGEMESTNTKRMMYAQFAVLHLGLFSSIALSFIIPYAPGILKSQVVVMLFRLILGAAFIVGIMRIYRRLTNAYVRAISSPDDHFSLFLLTIWLGFAFMAAPNNISGGEGVMLTYFLLTAFFLVYVPFSKISHYIFYPFHRLYIGKHFGRRGVFPIKRKPAYGTK